MPWGCRAWVLAIGTMASTWSGNRIAHSRACIPPSEPPATAASRSMPSTSRNARSVRTMSATVITGKSEPYGRPVAGSIDDGPVVPRQPPSRLVETTKKRSVSKALPGPIIPSHQPRPLPPYAVPVLGGEPVAGALVRRRPGDPGRMGVAAEGVADQDDVVPRGGEGAVGLVRHPDRVQLASAVQLHRFRQVDVLRFDTADRPGGESDNAMDASVVQIAVSR